MQNADFTTENLIIKSDAECLEDFLIDIDSLEPLNKWVGEFNIFDILKISRNEIRHSNILAWLLNPNDSHGFGDEIIKNIICDLVIKNKNHFTNCGIEYFNIALMDYDDFVILREMDNMDLLLLSEINKMVVCIENKVGSNEHSNQLLKYEKKVNETYRDYYKMFVFLTTDGRASEDINQSYNWVSYSYRDIIGVLNKSMVNKNIDPSAKILIENYIGTVRRYVMKDDGMVKICNDIYKKHRRALDLIFENKIDMASSLSLKIQEFCVEKAKNTTWLKYNPAYSVKSYVRFTTEILEKLIPPDKTVKSGWGNEYSAFYEIQVKDVVTVKLILCSINQNNDTLIMFENLCKIFLNDKTNKDGWQWKVLKSWKLPYFKYKKISDFEIDSEGFGDDFDKIIKQLDEIINKDILEFETEVKKKIEKIE